MNIDQELTRLGGQGIFHPADLPQFDNAKCRILRLLSDGKPHTAQEIISTSGQREGLRRLRDLRHHGFKIGRTRAGASRNFIYWLEQALLEPQAEVDALSQQLAANHAALAESF